MYTSQPQPSPALLPAGIGKVRPRAAMVSKGGASSSPASAYVLSGFPAGRALAFSTDMEASSHNQIAPASKKTGAKRGCVVLASAALRNHLEQLHTLRLPT